MTTKITLADLSEELLDYLNGLQAQIKRMAELTHVDAGTLKLAAMEATGRVQKAKAEQERQRANRAQLEEDRAQFTAWAGSTKFLFENAEEWAKEAALEWKSITIRNESEHGQSFIGNYREPNREELIKALDEYERWAKSDEDMYPEHRAKAIQALPIIKRKLAAILSK